MSRLPAAVCPWPGHQQRFEPVLRLPDWHRHNLHCSHPLRTPQISCPQYSTPAWPPAWPPHVPPRQLAVTCASEAPIFYPSLKRTHVTPLSERAHTFIWRGVNRMSVCSQDFCYAWQRSALSQGTLPDKHSLVATLSRTYMYPGSHAPRPAGDKLYPDTHSLTRGVPGSCTLTRTRPAGGHPDTHS